MTSVPVQQAVYHQRTDQPPTLQGYSAGFAEEWRPEAERIVAAFGTPPGGIGCALAVFALPLNARQIAVVRAADQTDAGAGRLLAFHFLVIERTAYERLGGDPFVLARQLPATWTAQGELPVLTWPTEPLRPRTVAEVQAVLRRVKASALREDEDPESPNFERTAENSESPALLGGTQVLVDGGKLVFQRPHADLTLVEGLWTLLPYSTRCKLWPASFAFDNELGFDVIVVPRLNVADFAGYTTEEQAASYPSGSYELALQVAAESGNQRDLDAVFRRRNSGEVLRMALWLLVGMMLLVIGSQWFAPSPSGVSEQHRKAAAAAGIIAVGDPWTAAAMLEHGERLWKRK